MDIVVRRAIPTDALFLTSISEGARRYWNDTDEYFSENLLITDEYLQDNIVFVAEKKNTIIGYCSLHYNPRTYSKGGEDIEEGYWLEHVFIRPAYIRNGIGRKLMEHIIDYCIENQIEVFYRLSQADVNGFYDKMGGQYIRDMAWQKSKGTICLFKFVVSRTQIGRIDIANEEGKIDYLKVSKEIDNDNKLERGEIMRKTLLGEKLFELDKDIEEDEVYNTEIIEDDFYEEFFNSIKPIGYKFECEEEREREEALMEKIKTQEKDVDISFKEDKLQYEKLVGEIEEGLNVAENGVIEIYKHEKKEKDTSYINTEKEKMLSGELYIAWGDEIVNDRKRARKLLKEFNNTNPEDKITTHSILEELFGAVGEHIHIEPDFKCTYGYNISVGNNFCASYNCVIVDHAKVIIGNNCILSPQVGIYTAAYPLEAKERILGYEYAKPIKIGDNVWIGAGAIINPGVTIGNNVVISPGAVIVSDIPDHVLVAGNPARVMNQI